MIDAVAHLSNPTVHCRQFAALLGRAFCRAVIARGTRRALSELSDEFLSNIGLSRRDVAFVANALASEYREPPCDRSAKTQNDMAIALIAIADGELYLDAAGRASSQ